VQEEWILDIGVSSQLLSILEQIVELSQEYDTRVSLRHYYFSFKTRFPRYDAYSRKRARHPKSK